MPTLVRNPHVVQPHRGLAAVPRSSLCGSVSPLLRGSKGPSDAAVAKPASATPTPPEKADRARCAFPRSQRCRRSWMSQPSPGDGFGLTLGRPHHRASLSQAPSQKPHLRRSGSRQARDVARNGRSPPSLSSSLLSHPGAATPAQPPAGHPRAPTTFILHLFPTRPFRLAASWASGHLGCGAPSSPYRGERNRVATAHLKERRHGGSRS